MEEEDGGGGWRRMEEERSGEGVWRGMNRGLVGFFAFSPVFPVWSWVLVLNPQRLPFGILHLHLAFASRCSCRRMWQFTFYICHLAERVAK